MVPVEAEGEHGREGKDDHVGGDDERRRPQRGEHACGPTRAGLDEALRLTGVTSTPRRARPLSGRRRTCLRAQSGWSSRGRERAAASSSAASTRAPAAAGASPHTPLRHTARHASLPERRRRRLRPRRGQVLPNDVRRLGRPPHLELGCAAPIRHPEVHRNLRTPSVGCGRCSSQQRAGRRSPSLATREAVLASVPADRAGGGGRAKGKG